VGTPSRKRLAIHWRNVRPADARYVYVEPLIAAAARAVSPVAKGGHLEGAAWVDLRRATV